MNVVTNKEFSTSNTVAEDAQTRLHLNTLSTAISSWFVRGNNKFYDIDNLNSPMSKLDVQRICMARIKEEFPAIKLEQALIRAVFKRAIDDRHDNRNQSIPVWSGVKVCQPGTADRFIWNKGSVSLNMWREPSYRNQKAEEISIEVVGQFLGRFFTRDVEQDMFLNWLAWCLQNEGDKPAWAPFFYSRTKGSGKSTLCHFLTKLFGEENSVTQNSVDKLTGRFNMTVLHSKLVISEELQLRSNSTQGNTLKAYITETTILAEQKGREAERVDQFCCFVMTSNHLPHWIEAGERRYYVINVDHEGHASGAQAAEFGVLVGRLHAFMEQPENVNAVYQWLMARDLPADFNAKSLNIEVHATPIMKQIQGASAQTSLDQLEELLNAKRVNAVSEADVVTLVKDDLKGNINSVKHMMPELGWVKSKVKWGGVDYARGIWVRPGFVIDRGMVIAPDGSKVKLTDNLAQPNGGLIDFEVIL